MASKVHSAGSIRVNVVAKSADFNAGMGKIEKKLLSLKKVGKSVGSVLKKALNPKTLIASAVGGFGLQKVTRDMAAFGSTMAKTGKITGIASDDVRDFVTLMEGDNIAMDKTISTLVRANKRIGDIRLDSRGPLQKLAKAGIFNEVEAEKIVSSIAQEGKTAIEIMDELGNVAVKFDFDETQIASLFDMVAGEDGRKMGAWVTQAVKDWGSLGAAMEHAGRLETADAADFTKLENLDQKILEFGKNFKDLFVRGVAGIADPLSDIIDKVNNWILDIKNDPDFTKNLTTGIEEVIDGAKTAFDQVMKILESVEKIINAVESLARSNWNPANWFNRDTPIGTVQPDQSFFGDAAGVEAPMGPGMASSEAKLMPARYPSGRRNPTAGMYPALDLPADRIAPKIDGTRILTPYRRFEKTRQRLDVFDELRKVFREQRNIPSGKNYFNAGNTGSRVNDAAVVSVVDSLAQIGPEFEGVSEALRAFVSGAKSELGGLKDFITNIAQTIFSNVIESTIVQPLSQGISGSLNSFFGTLWGGTDEVTGFESMLGDIWPFANGGRASEGMALVGERGPEVVDFSRPGMVYSNEQMRAAFGGGGGGVTINYSINSTDGPGVRAALAEATPGIVNAATAQVGDRASRPGGYRQQIRGYA